MKYLLVLSLLFISAQAQDIDLEEAIGLGDCYAVVNQKSILFGKGKRSAQVGKVKILLTEKVDLEPVKQLSVGRKFLLKKLYYSGQVERFVLWVEDEKENVALLHIDSDYSFTIDKFENELSKNRLDIDCEYLTPIEI
jgi:hypothetical protein